MSNGIKTVAFYEQALGPGVMYEATMNRLLGHIGDDIGFVICSAYKSYRSSSENQRLNMRLRKLLRRYGSTVRVQGGGYKETDGGTGKEASVDEHSFFVTGVTKDRAWELIRTIGKDDPDNDGYDQEAITWGSKDEGAYWLYRDDSEKYLGPAIRIGGDDEFWSRVRGKKFSLGQDGIPLKAFESLRYIPECHAGRWSWATELRDLYERQQTAERAVDRMLEQVGDQPESQ